MTQDLTEVITAYGAAWNEQDRDSRDALLAACWTEDGVYCDPNGMAPDREALSDMIGGVHAAMPGARLELTSGASVHHDRVHFTWQLRTAEGAIAIEGVDFGRLSEDGRLSEITGFFGAPPSA